MSDFKLPPAYQHGDHESNIYRLWDESGIFAANPSSDKPRFSISMPPPNETGTLHVGHALGMTIQDILARYHRAKGYDVLWLPGTDHAALATNAIIEKRLAEQGTNKHEIGRDAFLDQVRQFVGDSRSSINQQIKALGASCDWGRARYTLDDALNRCVNEVFVRMYKDGLIYRGHRIINWDPNLETTVSDDEVIHETRKTPFYTLKYGPFEIGTARPETKFGDKYVVVHPEDSRYAHFNHGETFEAEWINGKVTATIIKDEAIDPEFGTGAMTITPWHDHTDFEIAERHGLSSEQIIGFDGKLLEIAGEFAGMAIEDARPKIVEKLQQKGLLVNVDENYSNNVALNDRGKGVIEPQIMLQWFVDVNRPAVLWKGQLRSLKEVMRAVIEDGDIQIIPKRFEKIYFHWIDNLRDWCISRQIWWGHQIPVWYRGEGEKPEIYVGLLPPEGDGWKQDSDTLDTWFSSALWTWSTLVDQDLAKNLNLSLEQLLEQSPDFKAYHPTSVMETGWDILFFWVARMILATTYTTGMIPFKTVYLHGLVRSESGKKMSKSDPSSMIDPMEVIPEFGTDALRLALIAGTTAGSDQRLGKAKIIANRNFANKLWNIARYVESQGVISDTFYEPITSVDHWILNKLSIVTENIATAIEGYRFADAYDQLYHFVWDDFADWYVEASKVSLNGEVLSHVLRSVLKLAHPFAPFVTEAIWQQLWPDSGVLAAQSWPTVDEPDKNSAAEFDKLTRLISAARNTIAETRSEKPELYYQNAPEIEKNAVLLAKLAGLGEVSPFEQNNGYSGLKLTTSGFDAWLALDELAVKAYHEKLAKNLEDKKAEIALLNSRLESQEYLSKAPPELVAQTQQELKNAKQQLANIELQLQSQ